MVVATKSFFVSYKKYKIQSCNIKMKKNNRGGKYSKQIVVE